MITAAPSEGPDISPPEELPLILKVVVKPEGEVTVTGITSSLVSFPKYSKTKSNSVFPAPVDVAFGIVMFVFPVRS